MMRSQLLILFVFQITYSFRCFFNVISKLCKLASGFFSLFFLPLLLLLRLRLFFKSQLLFWCTRIQKRDKIFALCDRFIAFFFPCFNALLPSFLVIYLLIFLVLFLEISGMYVCSKHFSLIPKFKLFNFLLSFTDCCDLFSG